jgi:hypothetical protein
VHRRLHGRGWNPIGLRGDCDKDDQRGRDGERDQDEAKERPQRKPIRFGGK